MDHTGQAGAMVHGISKALVMFDENLKATLKTEKFNYQRLQEQLKEKNLVEEKLDEVSNSLKDNSFFNLNCYSIKCAKLNVLVAGSTGYIGIQLVKYT